jgi:RNA polymerase-binding transcription factor DksA
MHWIRRIAMTIRRGWRAWLAAVVPVGLAGLATLAFGRGSGSGFFPPREPGGPASSPALTGAPPASWPGLPPGRRVAAHPAGAANGREPSLLLPAWRTLLEARWQERLSTVTSLSLAYHDAAERSDGGRRAGDQPESPQLRRLMQEAVAARRALSDTEEALGRLSAGTYGRCEQCTVAIPATRLLQEPETRYCEPCVRQVAGQLAALPALGPST